MSQNPVENIQANSLNGQNNTNKQQEQPKRSSIFQKAVSQNNKIIKRNSLNNEIIKRRSLTHKNLKRKNVNNKIFKRKSLNRLGYRKSRYMIINDYEINKLNYSYALKCDKKIFFSIIGLY